MNRLLKIAMFSCFSVHAWATDVTLEKIRIETDVPAVKRGAETMMNACHSCHSMKYIKYRDLVNFGMDKQKVDVWRGNQSLDASLLAQMSESDALQAFGKAPPDLTLMVKARDGGADYVYSYLVGYYLTPEGMQGNHVYPGTKMPDILSISIATEDAQRTEIQGRARDIVSFLSWAADPHEAERIRLGYYVIAYLVVLTTLLYFVKNQIWSRLE
ncbi:cytochrome c1 [Candidatus Nitrotoga arctica]|uniref:Ubiquinol cytochrome C oxidoreductase, cytochrome C1 subunit n=1 Tax=Candidatus Nitrotoga arctica TaxID=453162 RepID=A0ABM8YX83_9PROT|nr:cytochrome c1 [Candidatus Nitrotoga arctica]CAG9932074.1 ubiquinol cytochrome C oxidoreductase, cytochrome C1 subunit [Candidatus Nitrotoga arctica]